MTRSGNFRFFLWELPRWLRRFGRGRNLEIPLFWPDFSALPKNSDFDLAVKEQIGNGLFLTNLEMSKQRDPNEKNFWRPSAAGIEGVSFQGTGARASTGGERDSFDPNLA